MAQWVVILGFVFGRQVLASIARANPALAPFVVPMLVLSFAFLMLTWISSPLFNLAVAFQPVRPAGPVARTADRLELDRRLLRAGGRVVRGVPGACRRALASFGMVYFGLLLLPLAVTFGRPPGKARRLMAAYTGGPGSAWACRCSA